MKSIEKMADLADRFEYKLSKFAEEPVVNQMGTTELFFDSLDNQLAYSKVIKSGAGTVAKILMDYVSASEKPASFSLSITAAPKKGASWALAVSPTTLTGAVSKALDAEFQKLMKQPMAEKQKLADAKAKSGLGSGTIKIGGLELSAD